MIGGGVLVTEVSQSQLSQKKFHLMRASVKFLDHNIDGEGVSVDPSKVEAIAKLSNADFMVEDGCTPSIWRNRSVLGMILYYDSELFFCSQTTLCSDSWTEKYSKGQNGS